LPAWKRALCDLEQSLLIQTTQIARRIRDQLIVLQVTQILLASYTGLPNEKPQGPDITLWQMRPVNWIVALVFDFGRVVADKRLAVVPTQLPMGHRRM
jgi:hypothetical protein